MTRFRFLAGVFGLGIAKAQTSEYGRIVEYRNGMCPVCGTMAEPWRPKIDGDIHMPRLVRCAKCSCAFYQDREIKA